MTRTATVRPTWRQRGRALQRDLDAALADLARAVAERDEALAQAQQAMDALASLPILDSDVLESFAERVSATPENHSPDTTRDGAPQE